MAHLTKSELWKYIKENIADHREKGLDWVHTSKKEMEEIYNTLNKGKPEVKKTEVKEVMVEKEEEIEQKVEEAPKARRGRKPKNANVAM